MPPHKRGSVSQGRDPLSRETRMCDTANAALEAHPEVRDDDQWMILIDSPSAKRGGGVFHNYEDGLEQILRMVTHLSAVCEAEGVDLGKLLDRAS